MSNPAADSVRVAVRIRPLNKRELERGCRIVVEQPSANEPQVVIGNGISGKPEAFTFNYVFPPEESQERLYESAVRPLLKKLYSGYNVTILAYGQTGSGKTFTMGTNYDGQEDETVGVIPRAINDIFEQIESLTDADTTVSCSFMELYQENLYDLLSTKANKEDRVVDIRESNNQIVIPGLTEIPIGSADETFEALMRGSQERAVASTAMNAVSSRSHAIFTLNLTNRSRGAKPTVTNSKFHLVDLAGSERPKKTQATGERFKEGVKINQGLLVLGNVISALGSAGGPLGHVPYRESKLTRLLQDSLGGNSLTLMVACVSPADYNCEETINTLRYANRAKNIRNKAVVNQDPNQAEIRRLNAIIQELRVELVAYSAGRKDGSPDGANRNSLAQGKSGIARSNSEHQLANGTFQTAEAARREKEMMQKIQTLQQQLQSALQDLATDQFRALTMEKIVDEIEALLAESEDSELKRLIREILDGYKQEAASIRAESQVSDSLMQSSAEEFQNRSDKHTQKQMKFRDELRQLTKELELKEELHRKCLGNISNMTFTVDDQSSVGDNERSEEYETKIKELEKQIEDLNGQLNTTKIVDKKSKLAEERRKKVQQLESELADLRKKSIQQAKLLQLKEKDTQRISNLSKEIQAMKATRVKLVKAMRSESENFRQWKINREKEICQLREKDRKMKNEMVRMRSVHDKQQNVLKRKVEEAVAVNKRLKDALERQKHVQAQRAAKAIGKPVRGADVTSWVDHELELIRSVKDASVTLKLLMDDRALLNAKLIDMKNQPDEHNEEEIKRQEHDLELRNAQIADLQQKILSTDVDSKQKSILEGIPTLPEAKQVLKKILTVFSETQEESAKTRHQLVDTRLTVECLEESVRQLTSELTEAKQQFTDETNEIAKMYEEKLSMLLISKQKFARQSHETASTCDNILQEASDRMEKLRQELDSVKEINRVLATQLEEAKNNRGGKRTRNNPKSTPIEYESEVEDEPEDDGDNEGMGESDRERDPDFRATPMRKRKKSTSVRESVLKKVTTNKKRTTTDDGSDATDRSSGAAKSSDTSAHSHCSCTTTCSTKRCGCKRLGEFCSDDCRCSKSCVNKKIDEEQSADESSDGGDKKVKTESVDQNDKENQSVNRDSSKVVNGISLEKRKSQDDSDTSPDDNTPKKIKHDILTPTYVYSVKKRKPLLDDI
ncbi:chromosome-associated kinesin KIF4-like [Toxorhynchites rutilus septentrionalis]|uniref:chromosome-associated kinesin KIF4-like n=1 Tax=Toxorhynchites rutilus septentrionalis TaxID=329112 RepID=UPI002478B0E8|nr:chromosome-associated kinesin KIF4-like [Toxorhynchites rutilus septentrionalis]